MKVIAIHILFWSMVLLLRCGDVPVSVNGDEYQPKIVVDGYLMPHQPVRRIRVMRNIPLERNLDLNEIILFDARVSLMDVSDNKSHSLVFDPGELSFKNADADLFIDYGKSYRLDVAATIDGFNVETRCTTCVPEKGFRIMDDQCFLQPLRYREKTADNQVQKFQIFFSRSPDTDSYISSIVALNANRETFIEENSYDIERQDMDDSNLMEILKNKSQWMRTQKAEGQSTMAIEWYNLWYYGRYRLILYAADKNFTDYFLSHRQVLDIDGNLWQPRFHFEGDGVGVFGAAIADTVYFEVLRH